MVKPGDIVRFLNDVGGGKVVRVEGNMAYVEDEIGFETPMLVRECVVVSESKPAPTAYDRPPQKAPSKLEVPTPSVVKPEEEELPIEETPEGDSMNVLLAYEPTDILNFSTTEFEAYLVNDSNYFLYFTYLSRGDGRWITRYSGIVEPNIQLRLEKFGYSQLADMSRIAIQLIAFKRDKEFAIKQPVSVEYRLDGTRFYKLHSFVECDYFDSKVMPFEIVRNDKPYQAITVDAEAIKRAIREKEEKRINSRPVTHHQKKKPELIECDLHINALLDTTAGMSTGDILNYQLDKFRETMDANIKRQGAKIVFIHGKGEGVLRKALLDELKRRYPRCTAQDASFREYGFGATLITIH